MQKTKKKKVSSKKSSSKPKKARPKKRSYQKKSKKGFELSVTFLVILIIAITIFGSGLYLIKKFFSVTQDIEERISGQTQKEIERRLIEAGEKVSVPFNREKAQVGDAVTFGLGILNTLGQQETFAVELSFNKAFTVKDQKEIFPEQEYINQDWVFSNIENQILKRNEHIILPLTIRVGSKMTSDPNAINTKKDTVYIFNVCVYKEVADKALKICENPKPTSDDLLKLHGNQIKKLYVEVI